MPQSTSACPLDCADACGVLVETDETGAFRALRGNPAHSWSRGHLCGKTAIYGDVVTSPERLRVPLLRAASGGFREVSWERALDVVAERLAALPGADVLALSYAGNMGLVSRKFPMRVMHALGASEADGTICDSASTAGYNLVLGDVIGADLEELGEADLLVLWGCDARRTLQHLMPRVKALCERGAPVFVVDIYRTDTLRTVESWGGTGVVLRPGTDAALALGLCGLAFDERAADLGFLKDECVGGAEFRAHVAGAWPLERVQELTGVAADDVRALARAVHAARNPFFKLGVGFARRANGGMSMRAACSWVAVLGRVDRVHYESSDVFGLDTGPIERPDLRPTPPNLVSHVALGAQLAEGRFHAGVVWGHNPAVTVPDSNRVRRGFARDDFFLVVHELFLTETARLADVVLPATAFVEHTDVVRSYGHRVLQLARKACAPPAAQRSNVDAFAALGARLGQPPACWDVSEEGLCRELLEAARERLGDEDLARVLAGEPVKLAPPDRPHRGTPSGRVELLSEAATHVGAPPMATWVPDAGAHAGRFWLVSAPSIATHNSTFSHSSRHAARAGAPRVFVHPGDAEALGVAQGEPLVLSNEQGRLTLPASLTTDVPRGLLRVDGFPRDDALPEGVGINALTSPATSDLAGGNVLYSARVDAAPLG
jgi:anaerobic selenocysteine-containing dehydrogenase